MATYVDGFVIPARKANVKAYKKMGTLVCKAWMKHAAPQYYERVGDDLETQWGLHG